MDKKKKIAQLVIARLDGKDINKKFKYYQLLVKKGIGGFIVFGGRLKEVSRSIKKLQDSSEIPLFIASDLEQGLGQHIEKGTLFPPAMAIGQAINPRNKKDISLLRKSISIIAQEAKAAGINTIFAPVLDVNTNPRNPIICTRAFSDNPEKVAWFGNEFIKGFQKHGIIACAKHFPGHGDTIKDSHRELPVVKADIKRLHDIELYPFSQAVKVGVKMIMVGHLKVPVLDSKFPSSLSQKIMQGLLREKMEFKGLVITDAMNMQALKMKEEKACVMALNAGTDIILHPSDPEKIIDYLSLKWDDIRPRVEESFKRVIRIKKQINEGQGSRVKRINVGTKSNWDLAYKLTLKTISPAKIKIVDKPIVLIIDDDDSKSGDFFVKAIKSNYTKVEIIYIDTKYQGSIREVLNTISNRTLIAAVFSKISAWKGRSGLSSKLKAILEKSVKASGYSVIVGFCCPYALSDIHPVRKRGQRFLSNGVKADAVINAYSGSEQAQEVAAKALFGP